MRDFQELDGENINLDSTEIPTMSAHDAIIDTDNFYPFQGDAIPMVAASAAQNTPDYFDQDNFYPMDGVMGNDEFSDASGIGDFFKSVGGAYGNAAKGLKDYLSPEERKARKEGRKARKDAKTEEIKSRAELNKNIGKETESDKTLAEALKASSTSPKVEDKKMSKTTKTLLIVGGVLVVGGLITFLVLRSKKK
jgi:hypothetical protein